MSDVFTDELVGWYRTHHRELPWRAPDYGAWGILVSEFMLQQTPVSRVIPAIENWLGRWPTPRDLAETAPAEAVRAWDRLGYPRRALWLHAAATEISQRHDGNVPKNVDELLALKGVGDYTARAVAVFAYRAHEPVVDTNTRRVIARCVSGQAEPGRHATARDLASMEALLPEPDLSPEFNAAMMELGATVCTARKPLCEQCPVSRHCVWRERDYPAFTGERKAVQKKYEGSDRQVRGTIMRALRNATVPVPHDELAALWPETAQFERSLAGLVADGLAAPDGDGYRLP